MIAAEIEAPVGPNFREQTHCVGAGSGFRIDQPEFDHLDVVLEDLHPLFRRGRHQQLADVLPGFQKRAGIVADPLDRCLPFGDVGEAPLHLPLFIFQPLQFRLDAGKPPRPEALQHFHEPADVGTNLRQAAAGQVFFFPEPDCLTAEAG